MFKYLLLVSAVLIALCAAYFSVSGIASLFGGHFWAVLVMASALELGKLVGASFLYRHWVGIAMILKSYMTVGVVVLMLITTIGAYGFLSAGYAAVAAAPQQTMAQMASVESQIQTINGNVIRWQQDNVALESRRQQAQHTLDNVLSGTTQLSQRSAFANLRQEIADLDKERTRNTELIQVAQREKVSLESDRIRLNSELNSAGKIGQFVYVAKTLNVPLDSTVKWFVLLLVFVLDPMAISLILAYNIVVRKEMAQDGPLQVNDVVPLQVNDVPPDHAEFVSLQKLGLATTRRELKKHRKPPKRKSSSPKKRSTKAKLSKESGKSTTPAEAPKSWSAPEVYQPSEQINPQQPPKEIEKHYGTSRG